MTVSESLLGVHTKANNNNIIKIRYGNVVDFNLKNLLKSLKTIKNKIRRK